VGVAGPCHERLCYDLTKLSDTTNKVSSLQNTEISREPYNNSENNTLIRKSIEELSSNSELMQVHFLCCVGQFS
jgi:hypothetical protein